MTQNTFFVNGNDIVEENKHDTLVATVFVENEDWKANARLLAAAPEMLNALKMFLDIPKIDQLGLEYGFSEEIKAAEEAIARAVAFQ